jgi:integrase
MASLKFIIQSKKKTRFAPVYLRLIDGSKVDIKVKTEFKLFPEYWLNKTQKFKSNIEFTDSFTEKMKNNLVEDFNDLRNCILKASNDKTREPTREWLKEVIFKYHHKGEAKNEINLNQFIDKFIADIKNGNRLSSKGERYKKGTIKNFEGFKVQFDLFQEEKKRKFNFEHITTDFYNDYLNFFTKKNYSPNTIGRHVKNLKTIVRIAYDEGLHQNLEINRKSFKVLRIPVENIYLTELELKAMFDLDLTQKQNYEVARDVFLIGCYTAQRFSDYSQIKKENIRIAPNGAKLINLRQQKTGEHVIIPIRPELDYLLSKYDYNVPKIWEQKLNKYIKEVGRLAKIKEIVPITKIKGGLTVKEDVFKYNLIKTHTARRSGCTNMYKAGIPTIAIMKISGHKTEREYLNYIKVSKQETAEVLTNHPYFTGTNLKVG